MKETKEILADYSHYEKSRNKRLDRLEQLKGLSVSPKAKGLYVLVIGESATRDHMESYGYKRHTTPFLESFKKDPGTLLFSKAFSNHTHTVPVLTYALSQKNQYNNIPLQKAYFLIEIAKKQDMRPIGSATSENMEHGTHPHQKWPEQQITKCLSMAVREKEWVPLIMTRPCWIMYRLSIALILLLLFFT